MKINLSPQRRDDALTVSKAGDVLTVNGHVFDFTALPEGATLPATAISSEFFNGDVARINGDLVLTLLLPHGAYPPEAAAHPAPLLDVQDGSIPLPTDKGRDNVEA